MTTQANAAVTDRAIFPHPVDKAKDITGGAYPLSYHNAIIVGCREGTISLADFQAGLATLLGNEDEVRTRLNKYTKPVLSRMSPKYYWHGEKKPKMVDDVWERLVDHYLLKHARPTLSFFFGEDVDKIKAANLVKVLEMCRGVTEQDLAEWAEFCKEKNAELDEANAEHTKALENPETRKEFLTFLAENKVADLSVEQLATWDALQGEFILDRRAEQELAAGKVSGLEIDAEVGAEDVVEDVHGKTGEPIFNVKLTTRLGTEKFKEAAGYARQMGGGYWKGNFYFQSPKDAEAFIKWVQGDDLDLTEQRAERKRIKALTRVERLWEMSDKMEATGEASLNQDRRTNTHRQAGMAASAEENARASINYARLMRGIADAVNAGSVTYLANIRTQVQLDELLDIQTGLRHDAPDALVYQEDRSRGRFSNCWNKGVTIDQKVFAAVRPKTSARVHLLIRLANDMACVKGYLMVSNRIHKLIAGLPEQADVNLESQTWLEQYKKIRAFAALSKTSSWDSVMQVKAAIIEQERLQQMGLTNDVMIRNALRELYAVQAGLDTVKADPTKLLVRGLIGNKIPGYFPTPWELADKLVERARIEPGHTVLEPSAGAGGIAGAIAKAHPDNNLTTIEINGSLREVLEAMGYAPSAHDFLEHTFTYDRIVMNPPFEDFQDIDHVRHAYSLLNEGGRMVAIMGAGVKNSRKKAVEFREWLEGEAGWMEDLPAGSFLSSERPTGVNTVKVELWK